MESLESQMEKVEKGKEKLNPVNLEMLSDVLHLPSQINALSFINKKVMRNDDTFEVMPYVIEKIHEATEDSDKIILMNDERGHLLTRLKKSYL